MEAVALHSNERAKPKPEASAEPAAQQGASPMPLAMKIGAFLNVPATVLIGFLLYTQLEVSAQQARDDRQNFREELRYQRQHDEKENRTLATRLDKLIEVNQALLHEVKKITDDGVLIP